jgi:hypothetical protein
MLPALENVIFGWFLEWLGIGDSGMVRDWGFGNGDWEIGIRDGKLGRVKKV